MKFRQLRKNEVISASKIVGQNYFSRYERASLEDFRAMFGKQWIRPQYRVIEAKKKPIAVAGFIASVMDYHTYELFWVNVAPEYQRRGIGTKLVAQVLSEIKKIRGKDKQAYLVLLGTTKPAFYGQFKFRTLLRFNKRKHYLMALSLE